ncbi:MAG: hypothetical protein HOQ29_20060 [Acidobacteria bacterium]|nr:hypothetical protein [Acidobacteriota bacterium]
MSTELERLVREARELLELKKRDTLRVLPQHRLSVLGDLQEVRCQPRRDRREGLAARIEADRPEIEAHTRPDVDPVEAAIGKAGRRCADRLAGGQIAIVRGHRQLSGAHPELKQAGVDVDERAASGAAEQPGIDRVVKVQQQIGAPQERFGLGSLVADETDVAAVLAVDRVEQRLALETEPLHALEEGREDGGVAFPIADRLELFQPVHVAAQTPQSLDVLHVHPEVTAAVRKVRDLVYGDHRGVHRARSASAPRTSAGRSWKPIN